jgi:hypothetical protein
VQVWKILLTQRPAAVAEVLVARVPSLRVDAPTDLLHGGFDLIVTKVRH